MRHFDLALFHVNNGLKVELQLFLSVHSLFIAHLGVLKLFNEVLLFMLHVVDVVSEEAESLLVFTLELLHADSDLTLMDNVFELLLHDFGKHVAITLKVVNLLLFFFGNYLVDCLSINLVAGVEQDDVILHLFNLGGWHHHFAVLLSALDERDDFP